MSIRLKFLLALLIAVLLPTAFAAVLGYRSSVIMARIVAADQRASLLTEAESVLLAVMSKNVDLFEQQMMVFYSATQVQQIEAIRCLEADPLLTDPRLPVAAFREGGSAPALRLSERHLIIHEDGSRAPALISLAATAIYVAPDGSTEDADRLASMAPSFQAIAPAMASSSYWQFVTLDSGVHAVYPGHGLLPEGYDARESAVYKRARASVGGGFGSSPSVDPATGQTLVGMIGPVTNAAGEIIGVTGALSRVDLVLDDLRLGTEWGQDAENLFVAIETAEEGKDRLLVIAERSHAQAELGRTGFIGVEEFHTEDPADNRFIIESLSDGGTGHRLVTIDGRVMLCCYAGFAQDRVGLVSLVPVESIGAIADQAGAQIRQRARTQLIGVLLGLIAFAGGLAFAAYIGASVFTRPIALLAGAIRQVAAGDLDVRAEVYARDEVGELAEAFNSMVPRLRDNLRLQNSLDLAQQVQRGLLPAEPPSIQGFDIAARSIYCDETGGDYFDFIEFDQPAPGSLAIAVGDVTGHGIAAALLMATARALLRMRVALPGELADHMGDINRHLAEDADSGRFMTLFFLVLDKGSHSARWVGAGHDPVLVYDPATDEFTQLEGADLPLGVEKGWEFTECSASSLRAGQVLFIGTDGVWETLNADDQMFGKDRLRSCIRQRARNNATAGEIVDSIVQEVCTFRGARPQDDDITLVVVKLDNQS